jgi:NSS family neurotransmitter:Na+ symporter
MSAQRTSYHGQWSSRWIFIMAATGSAVGLGNIWKFPYMAGENGGGAFVLIYLACIAVIGLPVMIAEILIGRRGRQSPINTMRSLVADGAHWAGWRFVGWLGVLAGFLILSFYSVVAGWALSYVGESATGAFVGADSATVNTLFSELKADPWQLAFWHTLFMALTIGVVARGVQSGLEQAVRYLMPALFLLLVVLTGYAMQSSGFDDGLAFLLQPDFGALSADGILAAMGQAFFTLSLGMGAIMVYGSYLPADASIPRTAATIALMDTTVALLAGIAIFPLVFTHGLSPSSGPGLIFETLPLAFGAMPGGVFFGTLFFLLLVFAAWTSAISLIEPMVAYLVENRDWGRVPAAVASGGAAWVVGLGSVVSLNVASDFDIFFGLTWFGFADYLTANIMLPLGGLLIAIFAGWVMPRAAVMEEVGLAGLLFRAWYGLVRYVTPVGVGLVFLHAIGLIGG